MIAHLAPTVSELVQYTLSLCTMLSFSSISAVSSKSRTGLITLSMSRFLLSGGVTAISIDTVSGEHIFSYDWLSMNAILFSRQLLYSFDKIGRLLTYRHILFADGGYGISSITPKLPVNKAV